MALAGALLADNNGVEPICIPLPRLPITKYTKSMQIGASPRHTRWITLLDTNTARGQARIFQFNGGLGTTLTRADTGTIR